MGLENILGVFLVPTDTSVKWEARELSLPRLLGGSNALWVICQVLNLRGLKATVGSRPKSPEASSGRGLWSAVSLQAPKAQVDRVNSECSSDCGAPTSSRKERENVVLRFLNEGNSKRELANFHQHEKVHPCCRQGWLTGIPSVPVESPPTHLTSRSGSPWQTVSFDEN